ncbi:MAG: SpoIID/LytB domain-containing protein [Marinifilaceae bacterium]|jgi:SpoIID/LytB domain protein|nr:SpoIID/LytB domain-containing protein [Marinifilaceae bacterium]
MSKKNTVSVGILKSNKIEFKFNGYYKDINGLEYNSNQCVEIIGGQIYLNEKAISINELYFTPVDDFNCFFTIQNVEIGIDFHWNRKENQSFKSVLKFILEDDSLRAVNILDVEDYLLSVISSEMHANCNIELLKAHTVIARSWLMFQIRNKKVSQSSDKIITENTIIDWFDKDDHDFFDVCADDHCQRYQGITKQTNQNVKKAVIATKGEVLVYHDRICDARYAKSCGGITEKYSAAWENMDYDYLKSFVDNKENNFAKPNSEVEWKDWIDSDFKCFCNTKDEEVLSQILNDYDRETKDFFRWEQSYKQAEIKNLLESNLNKEFGQILDLEVLERGESGRITKLRIKSELREMIIGKELIIRKALSNSHLYSSCFYVVKEGQTNGIPDSFRLIGAGWGHGVGLCQIGAAVMANQNYNYKEILNHYYRNAEILKVD